MWFPYHIHNGSTTELCPLPRNFPSNQTAAMSTNKFGLSPERRSRCPNALARSIGKRSQSRRALTIMFFFLTIKLIGAGFRYRCCSHAIQLLRIRSQRTNQHHATGVSSYWFDDLLNYCSDTVTRWPEVRCITISRVYTSHKDLLVSSYMMTK